MLLEGGIFVKTWKSKQDIDILPPIILDTEEVVLIFDI